MNESIEALELLKEELTTEEIHLKVNAIHRMKIVIMLMNTQMVQDNLLPYLEQLTMTEDDEVLFAISEELGNCWQLLSDKTLFIPLLEKLARSDETVVREQSARSLISICAALDDSQIQAVFVPMVIRLAQAEWFTGRVSSSMLFQHAYPRSGAQKERLRKKFMELCQEDTPMIRRACASRLGNFARQLEKKDVITELLPIFRQLAQDEQDQIRVLCLESLIPMAAHLSKEENQVHTLGTLLAAGEDKSWKVRLCFAKRFADFSCSFGKEIADKDLIGTFNKLLNDSEPEVKNAAIHSLSNSLENFSTEKIYSLILPQLQNVYAESQTSYKAGVALALCEMAGLLGKDYTLNKVLPILIELIKDESAEVRLNVIQNLYKIAEVVQTDLISPSFLTILTHLTKDLQWRVRMANIELIGYLSVEFGRDVYTKSLEVVFMTYITNSAASVRDMGNQQAKKMATNFKSDWVCNSFLPKIIETYNTEKLGFNYRMSCLNAMSSVIPAIQQDQVTKNIVPVLELALADKIPNVQFACSRLIKEHRKSIENHVFTAKIAPKLKDQMADEDKDVAYFATLALQEQ